MYLHKTKNGHYTPPCCYFSGELEVVEILRSGLCGKPDVVHFLYGDVFYKYFGLGLEGLKKKHKVVNTIHALKKGKVGIVSLKRIMHLSSVGVVHTDAIFNEVKDAGIKNVVHIEYPHFSTGYDIDKAGARKYYGLSENLSFEWIVWCFIFCGIKKGVSKYNEKSELY